MNKTLAKMLYCDASIWIDELRINWTLVRIARVIKGSMMCPECGGTGWSSRGYGDSSGCNICGSGEWSEPGSGKLKVDRIEVLKDLWHDLTKGQRHARQ